METESKLRNSLEQVYAALSNDPINRSIKDMIGQMGIMQLEHIDKEVKTHFAKSQSSLTK